MTDPVRIALLGRDGEAREHLRRALSDLGADIAVEGDPADLDPAAVMAASPAVVIVSLDGGVEEQLDRWDRLFDEPGVNVVFDEAEVTRQLAGWDLARWARHLASKVLQNGDSLPPPPPGAVPLPSVDMQPVPGAPPSPAQLQDGAKIEDYIQEAGALAGSVPVEPDPAGDRPARDAAPVVEASDPTASGAADEFDRLADAFSEDAGLVVSGEASGMESESPAAPRELADFDESAPLVSIALDGEDATGEIELDDDLAALAANIDAHVGPGGEDSGPDAAKHRAVPAPAPRQPEAPPAAAAEAEPSRPVASAPGSRFGDLSLAPIDEDDASADEASAPAAASVRQAAPEPAARPAGALDFDLDSLAAAFDLVPMEEEGGTVATRPGLILLLAGLGGPDAVRQFLGGLPSQLTVPVVVRQHLDAGNYDRLVTQLARASRIVTELASAGQSLEPAHVYVLPDRLGVRRNADGSLSFDAADVPEGGLVSSLAALGEDLSVFVLSGARLEDASAAAALAAGGAQVLAQDPNACFDAAAARAIVDAGLPAAEPAALAAEAERRWME